MKKKKTKSASVQALPIIKPNTITGSSVWQRPSDTVPGCLACRLHRAYVPPTVCLSSTSSINNENSSPGLQEPVYSPL